jgi:hypothetical protein
MSAALQLPMVWGASPAKSIEPAHPGRGETGGEKDASAARPRVSLAFYRRHTENMLRRYLYASMQVGRSPSILGDPVGRGWVSSRPVKTFEDALIFVLDVERCLDLLDRLDRRLLSRVVLQSYTHEETAALLGMSLRTVTNRLGRALDRLTEHLLTTGLLILPK